MRIFALAAALMVLLAAPAYPQGRGGAGGGAGGSAGGGKDATKTPQQLLDEQKQREDAEVERQYERRAKRPDADIKDDPWRNMRQSSPPAAKR